MSSTRAVLSNQVAKNWLWNLKKRVMTGSRRKQADKKNEY
jgi:hypothetical protein